ncbi:MAG: hypothetical protein IJ010_01080 [Ruminococcus sp.]|nr:hypothetical protein [Ruminococcus sp.]
MKRIQAACIMQTLRFQQKEDSGLSIETLIKLNREEVQRYKAQLDKNKTRYKIDEESEQPDGAVIVRIRKEYNSSASVGEYFE